MKLAMTPRGIIVVVLFVQTVCGSHFMGAYMSWAPASNNTVSLHFENWVFIYIAMYVTSVFDFHIL